jgi:hypothetical protein
MNIQAQLTKKNAANAITSHELEEVCTLHLAACTDASCVTFAVRVAVSQPCLQCGLLCFACTLTLRHKCQPYTADCSNVMQAGPISEREPEQSPASDVDTLAIHEVKACLQNDGIPFRFTSREASLRSKSEKAWRQA